MIPVPVFTKEEVESSSDGNQIKFLKNGRWYKVDSDGYEGLAESMTTMLLQASNIESYAVYKLERFSHNGRIKLGCSSENFLPDGCSLVTVARLFKQAYGRSPSIVCKGDILENRILSLVEKLSLLTGLSVDTVGSYLTRMFEVDSLILNRDRHFNNIAFVKNQDMFMPAPLFDHGDSYLLSDYTTGDIEDRIEKAIAKPVMVSFDEQTEAFHSLFGKQFELVKSPVVNIDKISYYDKEVVNEALSVLKYQFCDGNGRCGRLLMINYLIGQGFDKLKAISFSKSIAKNYNEYYSVFSQSENAYSDCTPFIEYMLDVFDDALYDVVLEKENPNKKDDAYVNDEEYVR